VTDPFHRLLRGTLTDLANQAQPASLLGPTRRKAREIQRRRRILAAGAVAGAAALTLVATLAAPSLLARQDERPPGVELTPTPTPAMPVPTDPSGVPANVVKLPGDLAVVAAVQESRSLRGSYVWDRHNKKYVQVFADGLDLAPVGTLVQVAGENGFRVFDLPTGENRTPNAMGWPVGDGLAAWSPDATKLASTSVNKASGQMRLTIADLSTGEVKTHELDALWRCGDFCQPTWHPNGTEVGLTVTDTSVPHDEALPDVQRGLQLVSASSGQPTRFLPIRGFPAGFNSWSPNGLSVIVSGTTTRTADRERQLQIVDAATGRVVGEVGVAQEQAKPVWLDNSRFLLPIRTGVLTFSSDGKQIDSFDMPPEFVNRLLVIGKP
jgi:hypothetical protein